MNLSVMEWQVHRWCIGKQRVSTCFFFSTENWGNNIFLLLRQYCYTRRVRWATQSYLIQLTYLLWIHREKMIEIHESTSCYSDVNRGLFKIVDDWFPSFIWSKSHSEYIDEQGKSRKLYDEPRIETTSMSLHFEVENWRTSSLFLLMSYEYPWHFMIRFHFLYQCKYCAIRTRHSIASEIVITKEIFSLIWSLRTLKQFEPETFSLWRKTTSQRL